MLLTLLLILRSLLPMLRPTVLPYQVKDNKEIHSMQTRLAREFKEKEAGVAMLEEKCNELMCLKVSVVVLCVVVVT